MEAGTCLLLDDHTARTAVWKPKSNLPCDCTQTMQIQYPFPFPRIWIASCKKGGLLRPDEHSCAHRSWERSLHWNRAMLVVATVSTYWLPPRDCSPACGARGHIASGHPTARTCQTWFLQHGSDCLVSILHPPTSKLSSRNSEMHLPQ